MRIKKLKRAFTEHTPKKAHAQHHRMKNAREWDARGGVGWFYRDAEMRLRYVEREFQSVIQSCKKMCKTGFALCDV